MQKSSAHRNRLAAETSPYLLQHADNPVDWFPWGSEALELAKSSGKPILLSIGYSACHWCHVMAHESFENESTAKLMNELFVNIKVDREERPDIDKIYQLAHHVLTQRGGGWPLTMFLTPDDRAPFFGGTYFPDTPRYGMPAFAELLQKVAAYYGEHRDSIAKQNAALMEVFAESIPPVASDATFGAAPLDAARGMLERQFDREYGGFGGAPKFPHATTLELLLRSWRHSAHAEQPDLQALYMTTLTLTRMAEGGIYDQIGGGFARYSVDQYWMIPHFEKMLYDNGPLLALYAQAALATGDALFRRTANETADWIVRDLLAPNGGFWSTLDADSEGHEGKFYVWRPDEVRSLLTDGEYAVLSLRFGLDRAPNFEGAWHLHAYKSLDEVAQLAGIPAPEVERVLQGAREKLLKARNARIWPGRDEKILTSWNALAIRGLAIAARALDRPDLGAHAARAIEFIRSELWRGGRLLVVHKDGIGKLPAYLDDYAFLLDAVIEQLQASWDSRHLEFAIALADALLAHFEDPAGGFYFTADDGEELIHRSKSFGDEAIPAGNGVAALALNRLGYLLAEPRYLQAAERTLKAGWSVMEKYPPGHASMLIALEEALHPVQIVVLRGVAHELKEWQRQLAKLYSPRRLVFAIPSDEPALPSALLDKRPREATIGYVCQGTVCSEPLQSVAAITALTRE